MSHEQPQDPKQASLERFTAPDLVSATEQVFNTGVPLENALDVLSQEKQDEVHGLIVKYAEIMSQPFSTNSNVMSERKITQKKLAEQVRQICDAAFE